MQRIPLLLLNLKLNANEKDQTRSVTIELTREELDGLIATLEEINSVRAQIHVQYFIKNTLMAYLLLKNMQ